MTAANRKFQQLKRKVQSINAWKTGKDRELETSSYPLCRGTFSDCPPEDEFKAAVEKDKSSPPERCKQCPVFKESKFYKPRPIVISPGVLKLLQETK